MYLRKSPIIVLFLTIREKFGNYVLYVFSVSGGTNVYLGGPSKKAKQRRLERKLAKQANCGQHQANSYQRVKNTKSTEKTLNDFINDVGPQDKHKLKVSNIRDVIIFR